MDMMTTPLAESLKIVITGLRNAGKSSLANNLLRKDVSIVSDTPGTTTDPVTRKMELGELGPVSVTDTAGIDDEGELGGLRTERSRRTVSSGDIMLLASPVHMAPTDHERSLVDMFSKNGRPVILALTFADRGAHPEKIRFAPDLPRVVVNNLTGEGVGEVKRLLLQKKGGISREITPLEGLVREGDLVLLVTPIDLAAPKGRLILPQVETIRDALDRDCGCFVVKERELYQFYQSLPVKPKLVITDSQVFSKVAADIPEEQELTSFSILFARKKGELDIFIEGVKMLKELPEKPKILILEACAHHRQADDIGTVKIPRLFRQLVSSEAEFSFTRNMPDPGEAQSFDLVIHCAACMLKRTVMMERLSVLGRSGVPVVNYGLFLAWANGLLPRALEPFPEAYRKW